MPKTHRPAAFAAVLLAVVLAAPTPAGAATRAQTDAQLDAAVKSVTTEVDSRIARLKVAKQAATAAESKLSAAAARLKATEDQIAGLRGAVIAQAVDAYIRPEGKRQPTFSGVDLAETSRQRALLAHVQQREGDALDELRVARQDLVVRHAAAARARDQVSKRQHDAAVELNALAHSLKDKQRLTSALAVRIRDAQEEDGIDDGSLRELIAKGDPYVPPKASKKSGLIWPLKGQITSGFGRRWGRLHAGIDIADPKGTAIHAAAAGKVIFSGWMGGYGNAIIINHGGDMATLYGHQSKRAANVGEVVKQGEVIGYVGSTGHSTGNHLHFEVRISGTPQNPRKFLP